MRNFLEDKSIHFLKADKGNCTVVMDKTDYDQKINTSHNVFNYATFVDEIENIHLDDNDIFVSFDVISLFTKVLVDETCAIVKIKLLADNQLASCTSLSVDEIVELLKLCLSSTCFQ